MRTIATLATGLFALAMTGTAFAADPAPEAPASEGLGSKGTFAIGAERMFGWNRGTMSVDDHDTDYSSLGMLWSGSHSGNLYSQPRLTMDYFPLQGLSVGGSLGYVSTSFNDENSEKYSGFVFTPRAGYLLGLGDHFGFWPRLGFSFYDTNNPDYSQFSLGGELNLVIAPTKSLGFLVGLVGDLGVAGSIESEVAGKTVSEDFRNKMWGITFGMTGLL